MKQSNSHLTLHSNGQKNIFPVKKTTHKTSCVTMEMAVSVSPHLVLYIHVSSVGKVSFVPLSRNR